jgi:hypothetical protein
MSNIIRKVKKLAKKSSTLTYYHQKLVWNRLYKNMSICDVEFVKKRYKERTGKEYNLDAPQTFDDKLTLLKLSNRDPLLTQCSDKYLVRQYVRDCGLEHILTKVYGIYEDARDINFESIPSPSFFKCNHTSGINAIYDRNKKFNKKQFIRNFNFFLKQNYYVVSREWNYKDISPKIICEEYLQSKNNEPLIDWRFLCFDGKVKYIFADIDTCAIDGTHNPAAKRNVYDQKMNLLDVKVTREKFDPKLIEKPSKFDDMIAYAEILSKPFPHCRVDFYNIDGHIYFGEMTFYHAGCCSVFEPEHWAKIFGDCIDITGYRIALDAQRIISKEDLKNKMKVG